MRLTCPNCDARYEIPEAALPPEGRDVQCSNCDTVWFQVHPDVALEDAETPPSAEAPEPPARQALDPAVANILRQEAETERRARQGRLRTDDGPEPSRPDVPAPPDAATPNDTAAAMAPPAPDAATPGVTRAAKAPPAPDAATPTDAPAAKAPPAPPAKPAEPADIVDAAGAGRAQFPDIAQINSGLRQDPDPAKVHGPDRSRRRGFGWGMALMLLLAAGLAAAYAFAPELARRLPEVDPYLTRYVRTVDDMRLWLDGQLQAALRWLDSVTAAPEG